MSVEIKNVGAIEIGFGYDSYSGTYDVYFDDRVYELKRNDFKALKKEIKNALDRGKEDK